MCRSRRELSNEYLLAKIGVDTADNEPLEVCGENSIQYSLHSLLPSDTVDAARDVPIAAAATDAVARSASARRTRSAPGGT